MPGPPGGIKIRGDFLNVSKWSLGGSGAGGEGSGLDAKKKTVVHLLEQQLPETGRVSREFDRFRPAAAEQLFAAKRDEGDDAGRLAG